MNSKKWLINLFIFIVIIILIIEIFYNFYGYNRHEVDYLVKNRIPNINNEQYDTLILGTSLSKNALGELNIHKNVLELTSNSGVTLAGNYFILKRYLSHNNKPNNLYVFIVPSILYENLDTVGTYSYFESVFNNNKEITEIKEIRPNLYTGRFSFDKYFESRLKSINIFRHYRQKGRVDHVNIIENSLDKFKQDDFMNENIYNRIEVAKENKYKIKIVPRTYIDKIKKLCDELDIKLTVVIEPLPSDINDIFKKSKIYKYILNKNITVLNINDYYSFNNNFFNRDGVHIRGKVNQFYQNLIDEYIVDIY